MLKDITLSVLCLYTIVNITLCPKGLEAQELPTWKYMGIDSTRNPLSAKKKGAWCFGLATGDITGDGLPDIISGKWVYINPGDDVKKKWRRVTFPIELDGLFVIDADGDKTMDIVAVKCNEQYWLEFAEDTAQPWKMVLIGQVPVCDHQISSQGYTSGRLTSNRSLELFLNGGGNDGTIYAITVPKEPEKGNWPFRKIVENTFMNKGLALGDIDGDGIMDVVTAIRAKPNSYTISWFREKVQKTEKWEHRSVGFTKNKPDRFAVADLDKDGDNDIVVTEGLWPGEKPDAGLFWFEQTKTGWRKHGLWTGYSLNSLSVDDLNEDGLPDIVAAEHKGPHKRIQLFENRGDKSFSLRTIDTGKENHLGAKLVDIDLDGDLDLVGFGWVDFKYMHLWINEGKK